MLNCDWCKFDLPRPQGLDRLYAAEPLLEVLLILGRHSRLPYAPEAMASIRSFLDMTVAGTLARDGMERWDETGRGFILNRMSAIAKEAEVRARAERAEEISARHFDQAATEVVERTQRRAAERAA